MSLSRNYPLNLHSWLAENEGDLAIVDFIPKLKEHILHQLLVHEIAPESDITPEQLNNLHIINDHIFWHKVLCVNYTTYNIHQDQDSINPQTHSNVIVLANNSDPNDTHPYWYAHIIGLFHADIWYNDPEGDFKDWKVFHVDFAWGTNPEAFGFLNPNEIIQAPEENNQDYERYSVDMWVDCNMIFQYCGLGVGHQVTWEATHVFQEDICKAYNLLPDFFDLGEDIDIESVSESESSDEAEDEQDSESKEENHEIDSDEVRVEDGESDIWEMDDSESDNAEVLEDLDGSDAGTWDLSHSTDLEDPEDNDVELDEEADGELDDICDDNDNDLLGVEPDFRYAAL
ncbi:hypothetical protein F5146DRAFT_1143603 [Armillaria mellea]|nr:hypothetical protein F5146DRAFT_1143603 [Armillaria mellea]